MVSDPNGRIIVGVVVLVGPPSVSDPSDDYPFILSNSNLSDCHQIDSGYTLWGESTSGPVIGLIQD